MKKFKKHILSIKKKYMRLFKRYMRLIKKYIRSFKKNLQSSKKKYIRLIKKKVMPSIKKRVLLIRKKSISFIKKCAFSIKNFIVTLIKKIIYFINKSIPVIKNYIIAAKNFIVPLTKKIILSIKNQAVTLTKKFILLMKKYKPIVRNQVVILTRKSASLTKKIILSVKIGIFYFIKRSFYLIKSGIVQLIRGINLLIKSIVPLFKRFIIINKKGTSSFIKKSSYFIKRGVIQLANEIILIIKSIIYLIKEVIIAIKNGVCYLVKKSVPLIKNNINKLYEVISLLIKKLISLYKSCTTSIKNSNFLIKKYARLSLLIIIGSLVTFFGTTYAKYIYKSVWNYYLKTVGFYFNSDNLDMITAKNVNNLWDGGSVTFNVRNNHNQVVITDYDINYNVVCTVLGDAASYATCHLNGTSSNTFEGTLPSIKVCVNNKSNDVDVSTYDEETCLNGGYSWESQISTQELYFDVVLTNQNYSISDVVVNITVTSTEPYTKTMSGDFTLHKRNTEVEDVILNYKNYTDYDRLIISNSHSEDKCVKLSWDFEKLIINEDISKFTSYNVDETGYINEITFKIEAKKSMSLEFYKKDFDIIYNVSEFLIQESDGCV